MTMLKPRLFDSYSGDHVAHVLDTLERRIEADSREAPASEFHQGRLSAILELRRILSEAHYRE
ncbi:hypothetical protein GTW51_18870 [Aurantimonas aggregata]|uniref:Uncharacterized protein n=1 Tax=Aurantimonas aggregata TaxID=2047720 RepID=A0A6L9MLP8_9HYPH|nr:hypothetical protein [Aurantimonas aggregata]NDV88763.1 hypothetical protein [Aurantimonas aggregata]